MWPFAAGVPLTSAQNGDLAGTFTLPHRVAEHLAARKKAWPIPWTRDDYQTTWLAPERLLLFPQFADGSDKLSVSASLDDRSLQFAPAYRSIRPYAASFVGFYADLSTIAPDRPHNLVTRLSVEAQSKFKGVFFDNIEPQFTEEITS